MAPSKVSVRYAFYYDYFLLISKWKYVLCLYVFCKST